MVRSVLHVVAGVMVIASLVSCSRRQPQYAAPIQPPDPVAAYDAEAARLSTHSYRGRADNAALNVTLTDVAPGLVQAHAEIGGRSCAGVFDGTGRVRGNVIVATSDPNAPRCQMTFVRAGTRLSVHPSVGCSMLSGASCGFEGTASQVR